MSPAPLHQSLMSPAHTVVGQLLESPQYYPGKITYMRDTQFSAISPGNLRAYTVLGQDEQFLYTVTPEHTAGFVFALEDLQSMDAQGAIPVLRLELRAIRLPGKPGVFQQAHRLRIRQAYSRQNIATHWYLFHAEHFGSIVSDFEHLEGGKTLWRSLVNGAAVRGLRVSLVDTVSGQSTPVGPSTLDADIWSLDSAHRSKVLVLEK